MTKRTNKKTAAKFDKNGYSDDMGELPDEKYLLPVSDFFASPKQIASRVKTQKITIGFAEDTITYFKQQAKQYGVAYQKMMREVLENYVRMADIKPSYN
jgi:predicted DNA binding CopG/RHH family protein